MLRIGNNFSNPTLKNFKASLDYRYFKGNKTTLNDIEQDFEKNTKDIDAIVTFCDCDIFTPSIKTENMYLGKRVSNTGLNIKFDKGYTFKDFLNEPKEKIVKILSILADAGKKSSESFEFSAKYLSKMHEIFGDDALECESFVFDLDEKINKTMLNKKAEHCEDLKKFLEKVTVRA